MRLWNGSTGSTTAGFEPTGNIPPAELEMAYYRQLEEWAMVA
jgi:hypothetical protein